MANKLMGMVIFIGFFNACSKLRGPTESGLKASVDTPTASAEEYYVDTEGSDSAAGTFSEPFATLEKAQSVVSGGDTVWIRGGVYRFVGNEDSPEAAIHLSKSGSPDQRIKYWAYPGEKPIFDFYEYKPKGRTATGSLCFEFVVARNFFFVFALIPCLRISLAVRGKLQSTPSRPVSTA